MIYRIMFMAKLQNLIFNRILRIVNVGGNKYMNYDFVDACFNQI